MLLGREAVLFKPVEEEHDLNVPFPRSERECSPGAFSIGDLDVSEDKIVDRRGCRQALSQQLKQYAVAHASINPSGARTVHCTRKWDLLGNSRGNARNR